MIVSASMDFELCGRLGAAEGRNSEVFRALDPQLEAEIVVKRMQKTSFASIDEYYHEARKLYEARHPNVVDIRYACHDPQFIYLAMPLYPGGSLNAIARVARLTTRQVVRFGLDMLQGLHHVHTQRLVHFDVKPSNVLIDASGKAALADFGIAKHMRVDGLATVDQLYFLHWPPEALATTDLSQAADIYQAGLTLYRLLVGIDSLETQARGLPRPELQTKIGSGDFPSRKSFPLHVPAPLVSIVRRALQVNPSDRFASVLDMIAALAAVSTGLDWLYSPGSDGLTHLWEIHGQEQIPSIRLERRGAMWDVETRMTNQATGASRRQTKHCRQAVGWNDARQAVQRALRELE